MKKYNIIFLLLMLCTTKSKAQTDSLPDLPQLVVKDTSMIAFIKSSIKYFKKEDKHWKEYYYVNVDLSPTIFQIKEPNSIVLAYASYSLLSYNYEFQYFNEKNQDLIGYSMIDDTPILFHRSTANYLAGSRHLFQFSNKSLKNLYEMLVKRDKKIKNNVKDISDSVYMIGNFLYLTEDRKIKYQH